jgi:hypothetical protein
MDTITADVTLEQGTDQTLAKRVLRKIDRLLIPLLFTTYMFNFMDKTILSSASVFGLRKDTVRTSQKKEESLTKTIHRGWLASSIAGYHRSSTLVTWDGYIQQLYSLLVCPLPNT